VGAKDQRTDVRGEPVRISPDEIAFDVDGVFADTFGVFVEDRLATCCLLEKNSIKPILFEQPWNRKPHPFPVVKSWDELSTLIAW
jgi:hypothetical protein